MFEISKERYREQMNLVQEKKADEVNMDTVSDGSSSGKKQRSKRGFKGDPTEETYEA
jgi:hypothetical protein